MNEENYFILCIQFCFGTPPPSNFTEIMALQQGASTWLELETCGNYGLM